MIWSELCPVSGELIIGLCLWYAHDEEETSEWSTFLPRLSSLHHRFFFFPKREQRTFIWFYYFIGSPGSHVMEPKRSPFLVIIYFHINLKEKPWRWRVCFWYPNCYKINAIKTQERWMQGAGGKAKLLGSGPELWLEEAVFCLSGDNSCYVHDSLQSFGRFWRYRTGEVWSSVVKELLFLWANDTLAVKEVCCDGGQDKAVQDWGWMFETSLIKWVCIYFFFWKIANPI